MAYTKEILHAIAQKHARYFNSVSEWNEFAAKMHLPKARTFIYTFGTWNRAKQAIFLDAPKVQYSEKPARDRKQELINIALAHADHFEKIKDWNKHAEEYNLPYSRCYIYLFGSWNRAKEVIFGSQKKKHGMLVKADDLITSAKIHKKAFTDIQSWNQYAEERDLPRAHYYIHYFKSWNQAKLFIFGETENIHYNPFRCYSDTELKKIALDHSHYFTTKKEWDLHSKKCQLPCSETYSNHFGGWNRAKILIFKNNICIKQRRPSKASSEKVT